MEWVWPVIKSLMGENIERPLYGKLEEFFPREKTKHRFLFGQAEYKNGELRCRPASRLGSHMLTSALDANCILGSDSGDGPLKPGDLIKIKLLPWKTL